MRLIDAEAFENEIVKTMRYVPKDAVLDVACMVNRAPTIEAKPVVHAHWITKQEAEEMNRYDLVYSCSACGHCDWDCTESESFKYCPNCGAQMDEEVSETKGERQ